MDRVKIAIIGAGSRSFGPGAIRDVALSKPLTERGVDLRLMDIVPEHLTDIEAYACHVAGQTGTDVAVSSTTHLDEAVAGADAVVAAIEVDRYRYWSMDYHVPRRYGFRQIFGENGGPGGIFHALRNIGPMLEIALAMERHCPRAPLLSYTNPEHKLVEAISRLSAVKAVGLCHGVHMGRGQIAHILGMDVDDLDTAACGINHFTWFQRIRDRRTGEDLYPRLREMEREGDWLSDWHEIGMSRVLFRLYGLWPSPATNHFGEYIRWAEEFYAGEMQYFYDPMDGAPWETGDIPEFVYSLSGDVAGRPFRPAPKPAERLEDQPLTPTGEAAIPIIESLACGVEHDLPAVNVPNKGAIPNLPDDGVVEVPARSDAKGLQPTACAPLPEPIAAMLRTQLSINKLVVEAFAEGSKAKLLQAVLLEPSVDSYRRAVEMVDEMLRLQKGLLPEMT